MKTVVLFFLNNQLYMLTVTVRRKGLAFFFLLKTGKGVILRTCLLLLER